MPFFSAFIDLISKKIGQFLLKQGSKLIFKDMLGGTLVGTVGKATADKAIDEFMKIAMEKTLASYDEYVANLMKKNVEEKVVENIAKEAVNIKNVEKKRVLKSKLEKDILEKIATSTSPEDAIKDAVKDVAQDEVKDILTEEFGDDLKEIADMVTTPKKISEENSEWVDLAISSFTALNEAQTDNPITQNNIATVKQMFVDSIEKNDTIEYVEKVLEFYSNKVESIILGLYNDETNTNRYGKGGDPEDGRRAFTDLINELADILHIPAPELFFS